MPQENDPLLVEITNRRDDLIALTQDLIRIPTLNPPGRNYRAICAYLAERLAKSGFAVEMIRAEGAIGDSVTYPRWNLVARHEGGAPGECVHFNSHHDVVEVGHGWTKDPFGGELEDGRIYGRGACDMKGGLAASIIAAEAFVALYPNHKGAVEISATADEESGGYGGVAYLAEKGYFDPNRVQHVIIPEPLNKDRIVVSGGPRSRPKGASRMGPCRFLATARSAIWAPCWKRSRRIFTRFSPPNAPICRSSPKVRNSLR